MKTKLSEQIAKYLTNKKYTLSIAESCTGGLVASTITNIPGSSNYFKLGIVAYSNEAKIDILNIPKRLIKKYGAVSKEVAIRMAKGIRKLSNTDFGLGITGIAGPGGGSKDKPVGLVYIACCDKNEIKFKKFNFKGDRIEIKEKITLACFEILKEFIYNTDFFTD